MAKAEIAEAKSAGAAVVVLEAAVLIEAGWQREVDEVWAVVVEPAVAVARACARDGIDAAAVQARIDAQISNDERTTGAHVVIDNAGDQAALVACLDGEWRRLESNAA